MGDISIKGRSPLLKGGRVGFSEGSKSKYISTVEPFEITPLIGPKGGGGKLTGPSRATGPIKSKGKVIGTRIAKAGSLKAMGIPRARFKSEAKFQNFKKNINKTPNKVFKSENISGKAQKKKIIQAERTRLNKQKKEPSERMAKGGKV